MSFVLVIFLALPAFAANEQFKSFPAEGIDTVVVNSKLGNIEVVPSADEKIHIKAKIKKDPCPVLAEKVQKKIVAKLGDTATENCKVDFTIGLPKNIGIETVTQSGDTTIEEVGGKIVFESENGDVEIKRAPPFITGKIRNGDVEIFYKSIGEKGEIKIETEAGNVVVVVPKNSTLAANLTTKTGRVVRDDWITFDEKAPFKVNVKSENGKLIFKKD